MRNPSLAGCALALLTLTGCPTSFTGNAHVQGGKSGCERKCKASGLRFSGMVFMGEYSTACICEPKPAMDASVPAVMPPLPPAPLPDLPSDAGAPQAAAATGAAVAMMMQTITDENRDPSITLYQLDRTIEEDEPDEP